MREWFAFLENFSLDEQLYFALPCRSEQTLEVTFRRDEIMMPWRLRKTGDLFWRETSSENLMDVLEHEGADINVFSTSLRQCILQQGAFAALVQRQVETLFGEAVQATIEDNDAFLQELTETVATMFPASDDGMDAPAAESKAKLRLVKS